MCVLAADTENVDLAGSTTVAGYIYIYIFLPKRNSHNGQTCLG